MGNPILQLGNTANWQLIYSQSFSAQQITATTYAPISKVVVPLLLDKFILAVYATSPSAKDTWHFAGFLNQSIRLGLVVGGAPDAEVVQKRKIWLNRITLIVLPKYTDTYSISFDIPKWFKDANLIIWQYTGVESDSTEEMISRIELKIDELSVT